MIWFLLVAGVLSVLVLKLLLAPLFREAPPGADEEPVAELFRRQLAATDEELAEGRLTAEEANAARTEITRRLLAAASHDQPPVETSRPRRLRDASWRFGAAIVIAGLLPAGSLAIYLAVGTPAAVERNDETASAGRHDAAELAAAADQIKAHLQQAPSDLKGWILLGRSLASLGRFAEARDAYEHAVALAPGNAGLHAEFGEMLVLEAQGTVTPTAEAEFRKAPDDPRARYYSAEAALQRGDPADAKHKLQTLLADAPPDAPWRQTVADRLAALSQEGGGAAPAKPVGSSAPAPGPSAAEVAAAQSMTPEQRQAMIRGMVERLANHLEQRPDDKAGWERLAHAYDVLGEPDKAKNARARAAAAANVAPTPAPSPRPSTQ